MRIIKIEKSSKKIDEQKQLTTKKNMLKIDSDFKIYDKESNKLVAVFVKKKLSQKHIHIGQRLHKFSQITRNRVQSAGLNCIVKFGKHQSLRKVANKVYSSIIGYKEGDNFAGPRQTALYRDHERELNTEFMPLIEKISQLYKKYVPSKFEKQRIFVDSLNQNMVIKNTVFTTLTVNKDFRTLSHYDKNDFKGGMSTLFVFNYNGNKTWSGGELILPHYNVFFNIEEGDLLFFDPHEMHGNNKLNGKGRVSLVCYVRENIKKCKGITKLQLKKFTSHKG